jgi:hypothetical protein
MHLVPVRDSVSKFSIALLQIQRKVEIELARPKSWGRGNWLKFHAALINCDFHRFFRNFGKLPTSFRVFIYYYIFALGVSVAYGSGHE